MERGGCKGGGGGGGGDEISRKTTVRLFLAAALAHQHPEAHDKQVMMST